MVSNHEGISDDGTIRGQMLKRAYNSNPFRPEELDTSKPQISP